MTKPIARRALAVVALSSALLQTVPAYSAVSDEASKLLERMTHAVHKLNYRATFVYQHDGHLQSMRIYHGSYPDGEKERLITLSGPTREVVRDNEKVTCILPDTKSVVVEESGPPRSFPISVPTELTELGKHYQVAVSGTERVAGIAAQKVTIRPSDHYRYGQNIWVGREHGLPLRAELLDENGRPIEQLMFTDVKLYKQLPQKLLEPQVRGEDMMRKHYTREQSEPIKPAASKWRLAQLPPGFHKDAHRHYVVPAAGTDVEHMVFSDGLASVSVFIEKEGGEAHQLDGLSHLGAVHAFGRRLDGHRVTVVGEVPAQTVEFIANGVKPVERAN